MNGHDGTFVYNRHVKKLDKLVDMHSFGDNLGVCLQLLTKEEIAKYLTT